MKIKKFIFFLILGMQVGLFAEPFLEDFDPRWQDIAPYRSTTERFLELHPYSEIIKKTKLSNFNIRQKSFYEVLISNEERGFMGYHGCSHSFRVFQDIIRITLEEIVKFEFKKDFYFFRFPGDPLVNNHSDAKDFLRKHPIIDDNIPEMRNQLISSNFNLYSNYDLLGECSIYLFEKSISYNPPIFEGKIKLFFEEMGMPGDSISELFNIGKMFKDYQAGNIFQIFDLSYQDPFNKRAYEFVDKFNYPSEVKGVPVKTNLLLSDLYHGIEGNQFLRQYRIVVNHAYFLNPFSSITMRRYDLNDAEEVKKYEAKLRTAIKAIPFDSAKVEAYKMKLKIMWKLAI